MPVLLVSAQSSVASTCDDSEDDDASEYEDVQEMLRPLKGKQPVRDIKPSKLTVY